MARTQGFLTRSIAKWRLWTDEPATDAKYTDTDVIHMLESSYQYILGEVYRSILMGRNSVVHPNTFCDIQLSSSSSQQRYPLHPYIRQILRVSLRNSDNDEEVSEIWTRGEYHPYGKGWRIEDTVLWVDENRFDEDLYLRIKYAPSGTAAMHEGTASAVAADGSTVSLDSSPSTGEYDTHTNAYAGSRLRILDAATNGYQQERIISSFDHTTSIATLHEPLTPVPSGQNISYEICPVTDQVMDQAIPFHAALDVLAIEDNPRKLSLIRNRFQNKIRELRLHYGHMDLAGGGKMESGRVLRR